MRSKGDLVEITINGKKYEFKKGMTILDATREIGLRIPTFCKHPELGGVGACRICVVEVEGEEFLEPSCSTPIKEGMVIWTHSPKVIEARKVIIELMLASHDADCTTCKKDTNCKLQTYAYNLGIEKTRFEGEKHIHTVDDTSPSIVRDPKKCILCGKCIQVCQKIQEVFAIEYKHRGFDTEIGPPFDFNMQNYVCINCGACVVNCPTAALTEKSQYNEVVDLLENKKKYTIVECAPAVRASIGEEFDLYPGTLVTGELATALRELGFDKIFDTCFSADLTIVEEANELIQRIKNNGIFPMFSSCCPAWTKFVEIFYPEFIPNLSSCKSPQQMLSGVIKNYYAKKIGKKPKDVAVVSVMPCTAKKFEMIREEMKNDTDYVLTTRELAKILKRDNINFPILTKGEFDLPLGMYSGAGVIFGATGGVAEACLRTAYELITGKELKDINFKKVRGMKFIKEATININGNKISIAVVHGLGNTRKLLEQIKKGKKKYHAVEVMACLGGCIGGGGQPVPTDMETIKKRANALYLEDRNKPIRQSHKNPMIQQLYKEFLGEPLSKTAEKVLHTKYHRRTI